MRSLSGLVTKKLSEYGFKIYRQYEDEKHDIILTEDMVILIFPENTIGIAFQATAKADIVASNVLILNEIPELMDIDIMEPFIYSTDNRLIQGNDAYQLVENSIKNKAIKDYMEEQTYKTILKNFECYDC